MTPTTYTLSAQREMLQRVRLHAAAKLLLPISVSTLSKSDAPRNTDRTYNARELVEWYVDRKIEKALRQTATEYADMLSGNGNGNGSASPALERYRGARASQEELRLAEMRGELVPPDIVRNVWAVIEIRMIAAQETLRREHGDSAWKIIDDALAEAEKVVNGDGKDSAQCPA